jgi:hypothetical protein
MSVKQQDRSEFRSRSSNACTILSEEEFRRVVEAAEIYLSARSVLMSFIATLGDIVERGLKKVPEDWQDEIKKKVREVLDLAHRVSITRMEHDPGRGSSDNLYTAMAVVSGAGGGTFGLPSILAELPITTGLILRSIADIGRSFGERFDDPQFSATCIEVFAYGGPLEEDDEADITFFMTRVGGVEFSELVAKVAVRYASTATPKIIAMSIPVIGAVTGAGINWIYMRFYQSMARVLFTLLPIERTHDPAQVRSCFASIVSEMRERQAGGRSANPGLVA